MKESVCPHCGAKRKTKYNGSFHVWHNMYECGYEEIGAIGEKRGAEYKPCGNK
ncbi:MAG: hypothetical protein KAH10_08615 [Flavobacteriales bacterium]|nr:hypothetical protein [Flavobacteriales bacterium]